MKIPLLEVIEVRDGGRVRVRLRGVLDLSGAPTVGERLRRHRERYCSTSTSSNSSI